MDQEDRVEGKPSWKSDEMFLLQFLCVILLWDTAAHTFQYLGLTLIISRDLQLMFHPTFKCLAETSQLIWIPAFTEGYFSPCQVGSEALAKADPHVKPNYLNASVWSCEGVCGRIWVNKNVHKHRLQLNLVRLMWLCILVWICEVL